MMKSTTKNASPRIDPATEVLTREKFRPIFEDIKELVQSTAKATVLELTRVMDEKFGMTWAAISEHSRLIKGLDGRIGGLEVKVDTLDKKIDGVRTELKDDIKGLRTELKDDMHQMEQRLDAKIDGVSIELKDVEQRLSDKIDGGKARLDDHESRITKLERCA